MGKKQSKWHEIRFTMPRLENRLRERIGGSFRTMYVNEE